MILITSAAYVSSELRSEFGAIPPSMLPIANKRLFHYQMELISADKNIALTLPDSYELDPHDALQLSNRSVLVIHISDGISLGASIRRAVSQLSFQPEESLSILHGDCLVYDIPEIPDLVTVAGVRENYTWAKLDAETGKFSERSFSDSTEKQLISNGYFSFSQPTLFTKCLKEANDNFIAAINLYTDSQKLSMIETKRWFDFGHGHTFYRSKSLITTQRAFNSMEVNGRVVKKSSADIDKLTAEFSWYKSMPASLKTYVPKLIDSQKTDLSYEYRIEYLHLLTLNELFVFGKLPIFVWQRVIDSIFEFLDEMRSFIPANEDTGAATLNGLTVVKSNSRLRKIEEQGLFSTTKPYTINGEKLFSLEELHFRSQKYLPAYVDKLSVFHGDLCFSNILFDFRSGSIKVIDPRGTNEYNQPTSYGDIRYDVAKLAHSALGLYDLIIAGYMQIDCENENIKFHISPTPLQTMVARIFINKALKSTSISIQEMYALQIQLFISMLPLHHDRPDRQAAFIANAFRLYKLLEDS